jgi:phosphinothricin acetyltransferase
VAASEFLEAYWNVNIAERSRVRPATPDDIPGILAIMNDAIASRVAFDEQPKSLEDAKRWYAEHDERYAMLVAVDDAGHVCGFGAINRYHGNHDSHGGVASIKCFLATGAQRRGLGTLLMGEMERHARQHGFHKLVVRTFPANRGSRRLLRNFGYRVVGVYKRDGVIDGAYVDVMALEKLLSPGHYRIGNPGTPE